MVETKTEKNATIKITTFRALMDDARNANVMTKKGKDSLRWFATKAKQIKITSSEWIRTQDKDRYRETTQLKIGGMYSFFYDAKWKDKLPYFDKFPCIFIFNIAGDRMWGINLHYLDYRTRAILMDELYSIENNAKLNKNKKLELTWSKLKGFTNFALVKPTVHCYLFNQLKSRLISIPYEEWNMAAFLPYQTFVDKTGRGLSAVTVWNDSYRKMKK